MAWAGQVAHIGEMRNGYKILAGKLEGIRQFGINRWEGTIKGHDSCVDWIHLAVVNLRVA
jgi:hypothetical protein